MLYNNLLFFLGLYSWNIKKTNFIDIILCKKNINYTPSPPIKHNKKLIEFIEKETANTPNINFYSDISIEIVNNNKNKVYIYNIYSLCIFIFLSNQIIYLLYNLFTLTDIENLDELLIIFLININNPIHYLWAKYYFTTNHLELFNLKCSLSNCYNVYFLTILLFFGVLINIAVNFMNINSFYNEYYFIYLFPKYIAFPFIVIEWIYTRILYAITTVSFTIVFCSHIKDIKLFINDISKSDFILDDSYCLSNMISKIANLRHSVEISIDLFNNIYSFLTITGGISFGILISQKIDNPDILTHEIYLIQSYVLMFICQIIFFYNVIVYSIYRNDLLKFIQGSSFINKFLTRWSTTKLKKKCNNDSSNYISKLILCIEEENATTLDWIIMDKLLRTKWMDFSIMGISSQDGSLIKKTITLSTIGLAILSYTQQ